MQVKKYQLSNVYEASQDRVRKIFDNFEKIYVSFSGGKDSSLMLHIVMEEAIKRNRKVGVLVIDLEAQYQDTVNHALHMVELYKDHIELFWTCVPLLLRNAVTNFEQRCIVTGKQIGRAHV